MKDIIHLRNIVVSASDVYTFTIIAILMFQRWRIICSLVNCLLEYLSVIKIVKYSDKDIKY